MDFAKLALEEYCSEDLSPHFGGKNGKPYWNINAAQCVYTPSFLFPKIIGAKKYRYTVTDCKGVDHIFEAATSNAYLTPVWKELPTGMITIKVEALNAAGEAEYFSGARTVFKSDPFPGREHLPPRASTYRECATRALRFIFNEPTVQCWLTDGKPTPKLRLYTFVSKIVGSIVSGMIDYAKLAPEDADTAIQLAKIGADFLIESSCGEDTALPGIPRTYLYENEEIRENSSVPEQRKIQVMMIYPAEVGSVYLKLAKATGETKYRDAALRIAEFYKKTVCPNGSWPLLLSTRTGEATVDKYCVAFAISEFLRQIYDETDEALWLELDKNYVAYIVENCHKNFDWQAQFEDSPVSYNYSNLTHMDADDMVIYLARHCADDPEKLAEADALMRFIEDQFVAWGAFSPYISPNTPEDATCWHSPAGMEQYNWYVPIDCSTTKILKAFLHLHKATGDPLLLEKACALADSVTRMQEENGIIPTHWFFEECGMKMFWFNCHIFSANTMMLLADFLGEE